MGSLSLERNCQEISLRQLVTVFYANTVLGPSLYDVGKRKERSVPPCEASRPDKIVLLRDSQKGHESDTVGSGFYNDIGKNPAVLDNLVNYLASLKGGNAAKRGLMLLQLLWSCLTLISMMKNCRAW